MRPHGAHAHAWEGESSCRSLQIAAVALSHQKRAVEAGQGELLAIGNCNALKVLSQSNSLCFPFHFMHLKDTFPRQHQRQQGSSLGPIGGGGGQEGLQWTPPAPPLAIYNPSAALQLCANGGRKKNERKKEERKGEGKTEREKAEWTAGFLGRLAFPSGQRSFSPVFA